MSPFSPGSMALLVLCLLLGIDHCCQFLGFAFSGLPSAPVCKGHMCGRSAIDNQPWDYLGHFSRIVGGSPVEKGAYPWQVSLKRREKHFCGGTIISAQWVITAAHCVMHKDMKTFLNVTAGEHDMNVVEQGEQTLSVDTIIRHPYFTLRKPMNYDIALLKMNGTFKFGQFVGPVCLPTQGETFEPGFICTTAGWGRLEENGHLPQVLHQVDLPILTKRKCAAMLLTLKRPVKGNTLLCAGFPDGGKDACQGDSGGSLMCRNKHGAWTLAGVTSWGMGCARSWRHNCQKIASYRGTPGVFTDLTKVLPWIHNTIEMGQRMKSSVALCSDQDGQLLGPEGQLSFPRHPQQFYGSDELCVWTIHVTGQMHIWLNFSHLDVEFEEFCHQDSLSVYSLEDRLIGKFCGVIAPSPIFISSSSVRLKFVSDATEYGTGFALTYKALKPKHSPDFGCVAMTVLFEEGIIQSLHYPDVYTNLISCHWIIHAPEDHIVKLEFQSFELEESDGCLSDSVIVYDDVEGKEEIARYCGFAVPPPELSSSSAILISFQADESQVFRGFQAAISFISETDLNILGTEDESELPSAGHGTVTDLETAGGRCGAASKPPRFLFTRIVGGQPAAARSWPWQVSLQIAAEHLCGGTVIGKSWVVTAAHCFNDKKQYVSVWMVIAGVHDLTERNNQQRRSIKDILIHPAFDRTTMDYDIALLQVAEPFQFNRYVRPVCLPEKGQEIPSSGMCVVTGWGSDHPDGEKSNKLQQLEVPILDSDVCQEYYQNLSVGVSQRMFCAGFPSKADKDSCSGDSGGPLVCSLEDSGLYALFGITSWGFGCGRLNYPGVYTSVTLFTDWIKQHLNDTGSELAD
uniref:Ovochymase-2 n=1 Tax=Phascolarctos cinereus TaxID=38626 RepID=A0A6P5LV67_PHACI|nr:ovochymase-2 [Phascolarctos cinereus]